jgi:hypothetical protein
MSALALWRRLRPAWLLTAVPFALLVNSAQVHMTLQIERDGSTRRIIAADTAPYFKNQVPKWINDVQAGCSWDRTWKSDTGTTYFYARDFRCQSPADSGVNSQLTISDVFQNPLWPYTVYTWREEVTFSYLYESDPAAAGAAGKELVYEIAMPGVVTDASVQPSKGSSAEVEAGGAVFKLDASQPTVTVEATSQRVRWGYLVLVAYILAFVVVKVFVAVGRTLRLKPRKI